MTFQEIFNEYDKDWTRYNREFSEWKRMRIKDDRICLYSGFNISYLKFEQLILDACKREFNFTDKQLGFIHSFCYERFHSSYSDFLRQMPEMCQTMKDFLVIKD